MCVYTVQSSTEVSTLADDYSSTLSVSDKQLPSASESTSLASQKVSAAAGDVPQPGTAWPASVEAEAAAAGRTATTSNKSHLTADVDSEGTWLYCLVMNE